MFLTVHAVSGIIIGEKTNNFLLAFLLSFLIHFIIDLIPHGDEELASLTEVQSQPGSGNIEKFREFVKISAIDWGIMFLLVLGGFGFNLFKNPLGVAFGVMGAIAPDILTASYFIISKNFILKKMERIHHFFHHSLIKKEIPAKVGVLMQGLIVILLFSWFFYFN